MKKYRYDDPSLRTPFQKVRPYLIMFVGWNLVGYLAWRFVTKQAAERDPAWELRTDSERIAAVYGSDPSKTVKHKYSLFSSPESDESKS